MYTFPDISIYREKKLLVWEDFKDIICWLTLASSSLDWILELVSHLIQLYNFSKLILLSSVLSFTILVFILFWLNLYLFWIFFIFRILLFVWLFLIFIAFTFFSVFCFTTRRCVWRSFWVTFLQIVLCLFDDTS